MDQLKENDWKGKYLEQIFDIYWANKNDYYYAPEIVTATLESERIKHIKKAIKYIAKSLNKNYEIYSLTSNYLVNLTELETITCPDDVEYFLRTDYMESIKNDFDEYKDSDYKGNYFGNPYKYSIACSLLKAELMNKIAEIQSQKITNQIPQTEPVHFSEPNPILKTQTANFLLLNELGIIDFLKDRYPDILINDHEIGKLLCQIMRYETETEKNSMRTLVRDLRNKPETLKTDKAMNEVNQILIFHKLRELK